MASQISSDRPNVLFIAVDDMRTQLGCYGHAEMVTPHLDALAASGVRFDGAYCNLPVCGPSRAATMTGLRPQLGRFMKRNCLAQVDAPHAVPLHTHFRRHGYHTISNGKVVDQPEDHIDGWSEPPWRANEAEGRFFDCYALPESLEIERRHKAVPPVTRGVHRGPAYECADVDDDTYSDGQTATRAIADLRRVSTSDTPFFMAIGFPRPHLPFIAPKRYWDLYPFDEIGLPTNYALPAGAPAAADREWNELRLYAGMPTEGPVPDDEARRVIQGYCACVSYVDAQVGRLLRTLDELDLAERTVVVFWSDHGYNLGEHGMWCKHTTFETNMRVPLIIRAPGHGDAGWAPSQFVLLSELYPTLCELAGLPVPEHVEGRSFADLMAADSVAPDRDTAVGRMYQAETLRTAVERYTEFFDAATGEGRGRMLYDLVNDPDETVNLAERPERAERVDILRSMLIDELPADHPFRAEPG
jgi:iduronate 2-sulfatase